MTGACVPCISGWDARAIDLFQCTSDSSFGWTEDVQVSAFTPYSWTPIELQYFEFNLLKFTAAQIQWSKL